MATTLTTTTGPARHNFELVVGDVFNATVTLKDENSVAIDLTGYTASLTINFATPYTQALTHNDSGGVITVALDPDDTEDFDIGCFKYGIEYKLVSGSDVQDRREILQGNFNILTEQVS